MTSKPDLTVVDLTGLTWRKSRRSDDSGGNCVEVAAVAGGIVVRDSKNPAGSVLAFNHAEWSAFNEGMLDGEFADLLA